MAVTHAVGNQVDRAAKKVARKTSGTTPALVDSTEHEHMHAPVISKPQNLRQENKHLRNAVAALLKENNRLLALTRKNMFPFLQLPAELRNEIYKYVLRVGEWRSDTKRLRRWSPSNRTQRLALLHVCKQIHAETHLLPFALNRFRLGYVSGFHLNKVNGINTLLSTRPSTPGLSFLQNLSPAQLRTIQSLRIDYHHAILANAYNEALNFLEILPAITQIRLNMDGNMAVLRIKKHHFRVYTYARNSSNSASFHQKLSIMIRAWKPDAEISIREKQSLRELGWET